jgi:fatty acid-binding protein DegV
LRRGGRIGRAQGFVGSLLKVKPILAFEAGEVVPVARARTRPRAIEEALRRAAACRPIIQAMAVHATTPDDLEYVASRLRGLAPDAPIMTGMLGPTLGVYGGPGLLGLAVVSSPTSSG